MVGTKFRVFIKCDIYVVARTRTSNLDSFVSGGTAGSDLCRSRNAERSVFTLVRSLAALVVGRPRRLAPTCVVCSETNRDFETVVLVCFLNAHSEENAVSGFETGPIVDIKYQLTK